MARIRCDDAPRGHPRCRSVADDGGAHPLSAGLPHLERDAVVELIRREPDSDEHAAIRELWKQHSIAEDARDLPGLIATLTDDCVYELPQTGHRWDGHEGAARFYTELLTAFPDVHFDLTDIVIGPQGVCEAARVTGTFERPWLAQAATGQRLTWTVVIFFPWDPKQRLFRGEKVFADWQGLQAPALQRDLNKA